MKRISLKYSCLCVTILFCLLAVLAGCVDESSKPVEPEKPKAVTKPNVIFMTLDTLRMDHLGAYGNPWINTPNLDRLARQNTQLTQCVATSNGTNPSHASMFTSLPCVMHNIYNNHSELSPELVCLPEVLKDAGYSTMAITSAFHLNPEISGFGQGYDTFLKSPEGQRPAGETLRELYKNPAWAQLGSKPFFGWFHFFDPHMLYEPPEIYRSFFYSGDPVNHEPDTTSDIPITKSLTGWIRGWIGQVKDINYLNKLYGGEVAYLDHCLGTVFNDLKERNLWDQTIIGITSDHGEGLGEHDVYFNHGTLFNEMIMVPLILKPVTNTVKPMLLDRPVSTIDIAPTLLAQSGLDSPDQFEGKAIEMTTQPNDDWSQRLLYSEAGFHHGSAVIQDKWKYYVSRQKNEKYLFDIKNGPTEEINLVKPIPDVAGKLADHLSAFVNREGASAAKDNSNPRITDQLKALGYVE